jgi:EKC/KEOPS complex subunit CGI121/TPRKB
MDVFQVLLAATKAAKDNESGKLSTQSLSSEILYNLSPSKNVRLMIYCLPRRPCY